MPGAGLAQGGLRRPIREAVEDDLIDGTQHPDFSATGASIEFGFVRINSTAIGGIVAFSTVAGLDNWSLTIHTAAPVPVIDDRGIALLALGLVLAGTWVSVRMSRAVAPR